MNEALCRRTDDLLRSLRTDGLGERERAHLAACPACADALLAERLLADYSRSLAAEARLPAAQTVLLRARLRARRELAERSLLPLAIWRALAAVVAAGGLALGLASAGPLFSGLGGGGGSSADLARLLMACGLLGLVALPFLARGHHRAA